MQFWVKYVDIYWMDCLEIFPETFMIPLDEYINFGDLKALTLDASGIRQCEGALCFGRTCTCVSSTVTSKFFPHIKACISIQNLLKMLKSWPHLADCINCNKIWCVLTSLCCGCGLCAKLPAVKPFCKKMYQATLKEYINLSSKMQLMQSCCILFSVSLIYWKQFIRAS